jgi:hypothetical protein
VHVRAARMNQLVLVIVRGLSDASEQDGNSHRQRNAPAKPGL